MPEHVDIVDGERHEPKGASTAIAGQVLKSVGSGSTVFEYLNYNEIDGDLPVSNTPLSIIDQVAFESQVSQLMTGSGTTQMVTFGAGGTSPGGSVTMDGAGTLTVNEAGTYGFIFELAPGRNASAGISVVFYRLVVNGTPLAPHAVGIDDAGNSQTARIRFTFIADVEVGNTLECEMLYDVDAGGDAGVVAVTALSASWGVSPSAIVNVLRYEG